MADFFGIQDIKENGAFKAYVMILPRTASVHHYYNVAFTALEYRIYMLFFLLYAPASKSRFVIKNCIFMIILLK